uniref:Uncharacterized protein n=1 Tax=Salix viminalis TaxID=40686 RepID=A0A6N2MWX4_SALVM
MPGRSGGIGHGFDVAVAGVRSWKVFVYGLPFNILEKINVKLIFHNGHACVCAIAMITWFPGTLPGPKTEYLKEQYIPQLSILRLEVAEPRGRSRRTRELWTGVLAIDPKIQKANHSEVGKLTIWTSGAQHPQLSDKLGKAKGEANSGMEGENYLRTSSMFIFPVFFLRVYIWTALCAEPFECHVVDWKKEFGVIDGIMAYILYKSRLPIHLPKL